MNPQSLALFFFASLGLALSPGPDILTVITRSVTQGRNAGLVATLGFATGLVAHTTAAALGIAILLRQSPRAQLAIQAFGAAYMVYLAVRVILAKDPIALDEKADSRPLSRIYGQSILMNILNPKVTLFFLFFLYKFIEPRGSLPLTLQFVVLGALFALATIIGFGGCALLSARLSRGLRNNPGAARPLRIGTAVLFLLIAVRLALP